MHVMHYRGGGGRTTTLTIFKSEAVHDGHPIEPVFVTGLPHREDARAITQQCALQPTGNVPYLKGWERKQHDSFIDEI